MSSVNDVCMPKLCARSWQQLMAMFGDVADGVRVRVEFRGFLFGREVSLWGDFCGFGVDLISGGVCARVLPIPASDDGSAAPILVPLVNLTDWTVE